jgi:hypothetical protein
MGGKSLATIIGGIVVYAVSAIVVTTMVTGTGTGDTLIQALFLVVLAVAVVMIVVKMI